MPVAVVTRTVLIKPRYFAPFGIGSIRAGLQARRTPGYLAGALRVTGEPWLSYWTLTVWRDGRSMVAFRDGGAHGALVPRMAGWARQTSVTAWRTEEETLPSWEEASRQMVRRPRFVELHRPDQDHLSGVLPVPRYGIPIPLPRRRQTR
ncbi:DUF3291 domain-containing protein [Nocardioides speluncae]|uniref:DUF3291 domain-containing protein n=1 Tax=Nocardioides speluncae TaxID=2670337 RepID=UPI00137B203A|nr:DUF3291 domain-containing protein [Nocardioides speluncae]